MTEITNENFDDYYTEILEALNKAHFIAFDAEFSGLYLDERLSFDDDPNQRYLKLKKPVQAFNLIQIGLSAFYADSNVSNKYTADTFNFFLFPRCTNFIEVNYSIQVSSFEFLAKYNFDFNKLVYKGVTFINNEQERLIRSKLERQAFFAGIERNLDEKYMLTIYSKINDWLLKSEENECLRLNPIKGISNSIVHKELRQRFNNIWTINDNKTIVIQKINQDLRKQYELSINEDDKQCFIDEILGFTKIFRHLIKLKKPLVGHNMLMDLMFIYEKFYEPLPRNIKEFKEKIHEAFPIIYDTKYIGLESRRILSEFYSDTTLESLYEGLNRDKVKSKSLFYPLIQHSKNSAVFMQAARYHQAGYDAFICGSVFLFLAHFICATSSKDTLCVQPKTFKDYIVCLKPFENKINFMKSLLYYINLTGIDPKKPNRQRLYVQSKDEPLEFQKLLDTFSSYGNCEIRLKSAFNAYVNINGRTSTQHIISSFADHKHYRVCKYSFIRHGPIKNIALCASLIFTSGLLVYSFIKVKK